MNRKPIFDTVRRILGRGFTPSEVRELDEAIDNAMREDVSRKVSSAGVALIKEFEGCELTAYPDPGTGGEPWTIGWGATRIDGRAVRKGDTITQAKADELLMIDINRHADDVIRAIGNTPTTQGQFDALVSFHFNTGAIGRSTLGQKHKAGDYVGAAAEFPKWNKAGGKVMKGLVRRRAAERELYLS